MSTIVVDRNRTVVHLVKLPYDVSDQEFISEIRVTSNPTSDLIATWDVEVVGDGSTGELKLTLDNSVTSAISRSIVVGYMDILRQQNGEPFTVLRGPIQVVFRDLPTQPTV